MTIIHHRIELFRLVDGDVVRVTRPGDPAYEREHVSDFATVQWIRLNVTQIDEVTFVRSEELAEVRCTVVGADTLATDELELENTMWKFG